MLKATFVTFSPSAIGRRQAGQTFSGTGPSASMVRGLPARLLLFAAVVQEFTNRRAGRPGPWRSSAAARCAPAAIQPRSGPAARRRGWCSRGSGSCGRGRRPRHGCARHGALARSRRQAGRSGSHPEPLQVAVPDDAFAFAVPAGEPDPALFVLGGEEPADGVVAVDALVR